MPRPRKTGPRRRHFSELTPMQIAYLRAGHDFYLLYMPDGWKPEEIREAWEEHGERVLVEHVREKPGTRPWAWWRFDAPEPRRQVNPGPEIVKTELSFGKPIGYADVPPDDMFESQYEYLERLGLLIPGEKEKLFGSANGSPSSN